MKSNLLTVSRMRAFRKCRQLHHYLYVEGWRPLREDENLSFGTLIHLGLEWWFLAHKEQRGAEALEVALAAIAGRARDAFTQVRAEEMLRAYDARWRDQQYEVVATEQTFTVPQINPETMALSRTWLYAGKLDALVRTADGRLLVVEHKTSSEDVTEGSPYWAKLALDHQVSIYYMAAERLGFQPQGCLYDVLRKPAQRPLLATPPEARKYTKDGKLYATQRERDETPEEYRIRIREAIAAEPDAFFRRREVPRTEAQMADFLADGWDQGREMADAERLDRHPKAPEACHAYGACPYWLLCSTGAKPEDYPADFIRIENVHPELELQPATTAEGGTQ